MEFDFDGNLDQLLEDPNYKQLPISKKHPGWTATYQKACDQSLAELKAQQNVRIITLDEYI